MANQREIIDCLITGIEHRNKYPEAVRQFCLSMNYKSPKAYAFLRETFNDHLPHPVTICSWYANSDLHTEPNTINEKCLDILKNKVDEKAKIGEKLICSIMFDEMSIRKHIQWSNSEHKFIGYYTGTKNDNVEPAQENQTKKSDVTNQALVFIVRGVNSDFQLPIAYHLITSLEANEKKKMVEELLEKVIDCGVVVSSITFDGFYANKRMCTLMGADLKINSPGFKPYISFKGQRICIFFDACHMVKLARNKLSMKEILLDDDGKEIKWKHFEDLVQMSDRGFTFAHRMTRSHIEWKNKRMKVDLAVQTLSESTASAMEFMKRKGFPEFLDAEPTIKFARIWNKLFDIFNTKKTENSNLFKRALTSGNSAEIFKFFDEAIIYMKKLKFKNEEGKLVVVSRSRINTGFNGMVINMTSLKILFSDFVQQQKIITVIPTYNFTQDPVEIFFGMIRSLGGFNDNPTSEQFIAAFRKALTSHVIMHSKNANCNVMENLTYSLQSNIGHVSSKRKTRHPIDMDKVSAVTEEQIEELYDKLTDIVNQSSTANSNQSKDVLLDTYSIERVAERIEKKIKYNKSYKCVRCKHVFDENKQKAENVSGSSEVACHSTFLICKQVEQYMKLDLLKQINIEVIYHEIFKNLNFDALYSETDFAEHKDHKVYFIHYIVDEYIRIKATNMARTATLKEHDKLLRARLHKIMHYLGQ